LDEELGKKGNPYEFPGILEIWLGRDDFYPTGLTFGSWYRDWMKDLVVRVLPLVSNERVVEKVRVGMTKAEVIGICGGESHEKTLAGMTFLCFSHLKTEFQLDPDKVVTRIVRLSLW
jgi:hypothetical protein